MRTAAIRRGCDLRERAGRAAGRRRPRVAAVRGVGDGGLLARDDSGLGLWREVDPGRGEAVAREPPKLVGMPPLARRAPHNQPEAAPPHGAVDVLDVELVRRPRADDGRRKPRA